MVPAMGRGGAGAAAVAFTLAAVIWLNQRETLPGRTTESDLSAPAAIDPAFVVTLPANLPENVRG